MKMEKRSYNQTKRAEATAAMRERIMQSLVELWLELELDSITLQAIAEAAQTTVQSIIRHFGSKDGLIDAVIEERASGIETTRDANRADDLDSALVDLVEHYERDADAVMRTLAISHSSVAAQKVVDHGMRVHRSWCSDCLGRFSSVDAGTISGITLDALVAATDIHVWKLLRRDLGRSKADVVQTMQHLARSVIHYSEQRDQK